MRLKTTLGLFLALLLLGGCVSQSSYQLKLDENQLLADSMEKLEGDYDRLGKANEELAGRNEELAESLAESMGKNSNLQKDLVRARADIERVEKVLSARSLEAGEAMAEMRRTIDGLEDSTRALEKDIIALEDETIRLEGEKGRLETERSRLEQRNRELADMVEKERIARQARIAKMKSTYDELVEKMESEIERGEVTISELKGKLTVNMVDRILFDSGESELKDAGLEVLRRVGDILKGVEKKGVRVEGHTDNVPISSRLRETYPTNWELSSARATNVVRFLKKEVGIKGERLSACAFGQYRPVADNDTAKGREENRRIQIVLVPLETETPR